MCGRQTQPGLADTFKLLSERWRKEFSFDPRLIGAWSLEVKDGRPHLICEMTFPDGVEPLVPPPAEKRIAIGGRFLDEVQIRMTATSYLSFPVESHRGTVDGNGIATIHAKMPTVVQLFAEGRLPPVGGTPVEVMVRGQKLGTHGALRGTLHQQRWTL